MYSVARMARAYRLTITALSICGSLAGCGTDRVGAPARDAASDTGGDASRDRVADASPARDAVQDQRSDGHEHLSDAKSDDGSFRDARTRDGAQGDATDGPAFRTYNGPGGATVSAAVEGLSISGDCSGVPADLFEMRFGCLTLTAPEPLTAPAEVCFPDPTSDPTASVIRCGEPKQDASTPCSALEYLFEGRCCAVLPGQTGTDPVCGETDSLGDFAGGIWADSDGDFVPDIADNCRFVPNSSQKDTDHDGVGDACDDCPYAYDPAQGGNDGGIGNACNCASSGVKLGPDGCPCSDGGAGSSADAGDVCGLIVFSDGGVSHK
jgi:hypothetical protein